MIRKIECIGCEYSSPQGHKKKMILIWIVVSAFIIGLSGALMPGPMLAVTIDHSLKKGFKAGPLVVLGHGILEFTLILLIFAGLGETIQKPIVVRILSLIGGMLLVFMGQDMVRKAHIVTFSTVETSKTISNSSVLGGILSSLSNPYWTLWWAVIGFAYLAVASQYGLIGIILFFIGHISSDLAWYSTVSFSLGKGKKVIPPRFYKALIYFCGGFLVIFGCFLFITIGCCNRIPELESPTIITFDSR